VTSVPEADTPGSEQAPGGDASPRPGGHRNLLTACLAMAVVILGSFGIWARTQASNADAAGAANLALTDRAETSQVRSQVTAAVNTIFSYSYADTSATSNAAQHLLTGPAIRQYNELFALVRREAPASRLILTTKVTNAGVELLSGDRARVLIFANQQDTVAGTDKTSYAGAMFAVTAVRSGGRWKIDGIDTFTGT
jgi:Mce-associated membrane protein